MPAPLRKPATARIDAAQAALEDANRKLAELTGKRNAALLKDDVAAAIALGVEIANLKLTARAHEDKIQLLRDEAAREEQARRDKEREGQIKQIEDKLAERDRAGADLGDAIRKADAAFRKLIDIGVEIQGQWNWLASDVPACLFSHNAISAALSHEMYRVGGHPMLGGGQVEEPHAGINFPGARTPRFELTHQPQRITPLATVLQEASAHAGRIMRGQKSSAPAAAAVSAMVINGAPRSAAEETLGALLKKQSVMAEDPSIDEADYKRLIDQIAEAQAQVSAEKRVEQQRA
jgi:hypothetical protein